MFNKVLVYLSMFFIFYDSFPFEKLHLGSNKPLSVIFLLIYFVLNIKSILRNKKYKIEKYIIAFLYISLIISLIKGTIFYGNIGNFFKYLNESIVFILVYFSLKDVLISNKFKLKSIINAIFYGYCFNNIFGIIQFIYIKTGNEALLKINELLLVKTNHLENGRLHFLFGEPSFIGTHLIIVIIPLIFLCKYKDIRVNNFIKFNMLLMFVLSFNSRSLRFALDTLIGLSIILLIIYRKKISKFMIVIVSMVMVLFLVIPSVLETYSDNLLVMRISNILNQSSEVVDYSIWARKDYSLVGIQALKKKSILGYGGGYYNQAYRENIFAADSNYGENPELLRNYDMDYLNSINMYMRFASEFGITGLIALIMFIIGLFRKADNDLLKAIIILILYNWIQNDSFVLITIIFWIAFIINNKLIIERGRLK